MSSPGVPPARSATFARGDKLALASLVVMSGFLASVAFHYWQGAYEGLRYPHDTYLYRPADTLHYLEPVGTRRHVFGDLLAVCIHARGRTPYRATLPAPDGTWRPFPSNYPPLGAMMAWPLTLVPYRWAIATFLAGSVAGLVWFGRSFFRGGNPLHDAMHVVALCLMSCPVHMNLDRGNIEIVVFGALAAGVAFLVRRRCGAAAGFIGAAIAMKIFPAVFLPLVARCCGWRSAAATVLVVVISSVGALLAMAQSPTESVRQLGESLVGFSGRMNEGLNAAVFSSSLYAPVAVLDWYAGVDRSLQPLAATSRAAYPVVAAAALAGMVWLTLAGRLRTWEAVTLATLCMLGLPKATPDYRLVHLLLPLALFVHSRSPRGSGIAVTTLFALLLVPKSWVWIAPEVSIGALVNPACMAALAAVVVGGAVRRRHRPAGSDRNRGTAGPASEGPLPKRQRGAAPGRSHAFATNVFSAG